TETLFSVPSVALSGIVHRVGRASLATRKKTKRPERWNDSPRRGNPFGWLIVAVGAMGLLYTACAPRVRQSLAPAVAQAPQVAGEVSRNAGAGNVVALSFGGCYDDNPLPGILTALQQHGYHATFFVAGLFARRYPDSVKRIADAGMEIGNHSWTHPKFTTLSD